MKKPVALILVTMILLSGCGLPNPSETGTEFATSSQPTQIDTQQSSREITCEPTSEPTTASIPEPTGTALETSLETTQKITSAETIESSDTPDPETEYSITLKRDILVMMIAYPDHVVGVEKHENKVFLMMKSGESILYDDQKNKTADEKISDADVQDMLETLYPLSEVNTLMDTGVDPGRMRAYAVFDDIYGNSKDAISSKLISVGFGEQRLPFNKEAGAADALKAAVAAAAALVEEQPSVADYLYPSSGTFNYRVIAGTDRLSPHAYAIAIDLKSTSNGYWRWASAAQGDELLQVYPQDLVRLFENYGFIWGGKWNHFDIFHFEYRPEIIIKAKYFSGGIDTANPWYQGADLDNGSANEYIAQIEKTLG